MARRFQCCYCITLTYIVTISGLVTVLNTNLGWWHKQSMPNPISKKIPQKYIQLKGKVDMSGFFYLRYHAVLGYRRDGRYTAVHSAFF